MMLFDKLGEIERPAPPRKAALVFAALTAVLLIASAVLQFRASAARWIDFGRTVEGNELSVESDQYDYYFPDGEFFPLENTAFPLGIALMIQALGLLCLLATLAALRERSTRAILFTALPLGCSPPQASPCWDFTPYFRRSRANPAHCRAHGFLTSRY